MSLSPRLVLAGVIALAGSLAGLVAAQPPPAKIVVESSALKTGEPMPRDYTPDGRNISPPIT